MFCFRLSFFPRGVGPGRLRAERMASGRADGFRQGGWLQAGQPDRATGPDRWLRAGRANHLFNWRLGPVSQPVVQPVLQPVVQPSLQPKQSSFLQPVLQPTQSPVLQPVVQPSLQPKQSPVLQPLLQPTLPTVMPMHLNRSRRQCNEIPEEQHRQSSKIYVKLHIFIRKAKLSTT